MGSGAGEQAPPPLGHAVPADGMHTASDAPQATAQAHEEAGLELRAATYADLPALAQLYSLAFESNPGYRWIFTGDPQQPAPEGALSWLFYRRARMLLQRGCPLLVCSNATGQLLAAGGIIPFDRKPGAVDFLRNGILMWLPWYGLASLKRALSMDSGLAALHNSGVLEGAAGELSMVAVRPDMHGRGLGSRLMAELFKQWDAADGHTLLIMTQDRRAVRMYEQCGCTPLDAGQPEERHPQGGFSNWVLLRPGRAQGGQ